MEEKFKQQIPIILVDYAERSALFPLTHTRAMADLLTGMMTIKQRWEVLSGNKVYVQTENFLQPLYEPIPDGEFYYVNAAVIPSKHLVKAIYELQNGQCIKDQNGWIAKRGTFNTSCQLLITEENGTHSIQTENINRIDSLFGLIQLNETFLLSDFDLLIKPNQPVQNLSATLINSPHIYIDSNAEINPCIINATHGPVYISKGVVIMEGVTIRGPVYIGEGTVVKMGTRIYGGTSVGPFCTVGGEIKNSILQGFSNKAHDGYLGDSFIGEWCNMGAGTSCSNVKNTAGTIHQWSEKEDRFIAAGNKCGVVMGDYSKTAINTSINTGCVIGVVCNVFCNGLTPSHIPSFSWGINGDKYQVDKAIADIGNWMVFKRKTILPAKEGIIRYLAAQ